MVYFDDKFSKHFKSQLGEDAVSNFIDSMIKENKYCSEMMERHFSKKLVMTRKDNEYFKNSSRCRICENTDVKVDFKVRDHSHITGKCKGSGHRDCDIIVKQVIKFLLYSTT